MQTLLRLHCIRELAEKLLPVRPPRTRIGKHVIDLVDGGEERTPLLPIDLGPDEVANGKVDQPRGRLAWRPGLQQRESVRIVFWQCRAWVR